MKYAFNVYQMKVEQHEFWVAESKELNGCVGQGETAQDAINELEENEQVWLDTAKEYNIPIPQHSFVKENSHSGKFTVRVSPETHEKTVECAEKQGISLNQYVNNAIIEKNTGTLISNIIKNFFNPQVLTANVNNSSDMPLIFENYVTPNNEETVNIFFAPACLKS